MPTVTTIAIGAQSNAAYQLGGLIHSAAIYTSRLTDAQLQVESSPTTVPVAHGGIPYLGLGVRVGFL